MAIPFWGLGSFALFAVLFNFLTLVVFASFSVSLYSQLHPGFEDLLLAGGDNAERPTAEDSRESVDEHAA